MLSLSTLKPLTSHWALSFWQSARGGRYCADGVERGISDIKYELIVLLLPFLFLNLLYFVSPVPYFSASAEQKRENGEGEAEEHTNMAAGGNEANHITHQLSQHKFHSKLLQI